MFMQSHPEPLPIRQPPQVDARYRKEGLHLSTEAGGEIKRTRQVRVAVPFWKNPRVWMIGGAVAVCGVIALVAFRVQQSVGGQDGTYVAQEEPINHEAVLAGPNQAAEESFTSSHGVLEELQDGVLVNEAWYYLEQADVAIVKEGEPCYRQSRTCALNQFQLDTERMLDEAAKANDTKAMNAALFRFEAVELARTLDQPPADLQIQTARAAIQSVVGYHERNFQLSVEKKAYELNQTDAR
jgi:hypothetical protein